MRVYISSLLLFISSCMMAQTDFDIEGHRGCRGLYPENTIPAFLHAVQLGVNTLELDIVVSKDNQLVVSHDPYMNSTICLRPDGTPVSFDDGEKYKIYDMNYDSIKKFDCGSSGNPKFPEQVKMKVYKPLLSEVIDSVEKYVKDHHLPPMHYNIETKSTVKGDEFTTPKPEPFTRLFYNLVKAKGVLNRCTLQSFDPRTLQVIHRLDSTVVTALLVENLEGFSKNIKNLGFTPTIYSPNVALVNKKLIEACHDAGVKILPWTVNEEKKMKALKEMGVDGLISDYPDRAIKVLR